MIRPSLLTAIQTQIVLNVHYKRDTSLPYLPIASVFLWWAVSNILSYGVRPALSHLIPNLCTFSLSLASLEHELVKQTELSSSPFSSSVPFLSMLFNLNLSYFPGQEMMPRSVSPLKSINL